MKRILSIAAALLLIFCLTGCEEEGLPTATKEFYVNDFAEVLTAEDEQRILSSSVALAEATTAQVVVVTVKSLGGEEPADYALQLGREWGVGDKEQNNGVVVLLSSEDREIYISVGYGLEGALPDSKTGRIIDVYGLEYLKNDDFSKGITEISNAIVNEVYIEYGLEPESGYVTIDKVVKDESLDYGGKVASSWMILVALVVLVFLLSGRRGRRILFFGGPGSFHGGGFGCGFGGPRSGGGFGGFSGGGGSFGGGGAGRGF